MLRLVVKSSAITSIGHDDKTCVLEIEYKNGIVYRYRGVPRHVWDELRHAKSISAYVNAKIRDKYDFVE